jgi:hypothetical protein
MEAPEVQHENVLILCVYTHFSMFALLKWLEEVLKKKFFLSHEARLQKGNEVFYWEVYKMTDDIFKTEVLLVSNESAGNVYKGMTGGTDIFGEELYRVKTCYLRDDWKDTVKYLMLFSGEYEYSDEIVRFLLDSSDDNQIKFGKSAYFPGILFLKEISEIGKK